MEEPEDSIGYKSSVINSDNGDFKFLKAMGGERGEKEEGFEDSGMGLVTGIEDAWFVA
jgi:hypothetical protein